MSKLDWFDEEPREVDWGPYDDAGRADFWWDRKTDEPKWLLALTWTAMGVACVAIWVYVIIPFISYLFDAARGVGS